MLELQEIPDSLLVIGGGYIGLEMGTVYAEIGSKVSVVELTENLLPGADRDLVKPLQTRLEKLFEAIHLKTKVAGLEERKKGILVRFEGPDGPFEKEFSRVLVAVGRAPDFDGLGLEKTSVTVNAKGFVEVDGQQGCTSDAKILAIGDVCGEPMLAHRASHQGKVAVEALHGGPAGSRCAVSRRSCSPTGDPWAGLTEQEVKASGRTVEISRYPWAASGRAQALGRRRG